MNKIFRYVLVVFALTSMLLSACAGAPAAASQSGGSKVQADSVAYTGAIESINGDQWVVNGQTITVDPAVVRDGPFNVGDIVKVEVQVNQDGSMVVTRVEVPSPSDLSELPGLGDDNSNTSVDNANDNVNANDNGNSNGDNSNDSNSNDDNSNDSNSNDDNSNGNGNGSDDNSNGNGNSNDDDSNANGNSNDDDDDDNSNSSNSNDDDGDDDNSNDGNSNGDDNSNDNSNGNGNSNDGNTNAAP